jgi:hypothetical protein
MKQEPSLRGAQATKQSRVLPGTGLLCFASLAMTALGARVRRNATGNNRRDARACPGHPRSFSPELTTDVDGRDKPGHDDRTTSLHTRIFSRNDFVAENIRFVLDLGRLVTRRRIGIQP